MKDVLKALFLYKILRRKGRIIVKIKYRIKEVSGGWQVLINDKPEGISFIHQEGAEHEIERLKTLE